MATKTRIGVIPVYKGTWSNIVTYGLDNRVTDANGDYYVSLKDDNLNHALTDTAWWGKVTCAKEASDAATAATSANSAESARVEAESSRVTAEQGRKDAESARVEAESKREETVDSYMEVIKKPVVSTSDATVNMDANKFYGITVDTALTLNINAATDTAITNDWEGSFDTGATAPTVTWPENVNWGTSYMELAPNTHYEFSIRLSGGKYYGILYGWS